MIDLWAVKWNPCNTCRVIAVMVALFAFLTLLDYGAGGSDFFGLKYYAGAHVPLAVEMFLVFVYAAAIWILCERIVVDRFIRNKRRGSKHR